jgi:uncharacterized protein (TIGR04255 family)
MQRLPNTLNKNPIIDAVFELRFSSNFPASEILPGFLFSKLEGDKKIGALPASQLPKELRDADANLQFAPVIRLDWREYHISIGDKTICIGYKSKYPGWCDFKKVIIKILEQIKELKIFNSIDRYSLKYISLLDKPYAKDISTLINIDMCIAGRSVKEEGFTIRLELHEDKFLSILQIISNASVEIPETPKRTGLIIDVDTIYETNKKPFDDVCSDFEKTLENIHNTGKKIFFECLTESTLVSLEPVYG